MSVFSTVKLFDLGQAPEIVQNAIHPIARVHVSTVDGTAIWEVTVGAYDWQDAADRRRDQRRGDRTDTGDRRQTAGGFIGAGMRNDLGFESLDPFIQFLAILMQSGDRLFGLSWNGPVRIDKRRQFVELSYPFLER
jgi:hypothetical protein